MEALLVGYEVNGPTWFYLSLLLILSVFFRFNRVWSWRNLDLLLLLALAPGVLLVQATGASSSLGYVWLFVVNGLLAARLLLDGLLTRRPRFEQNLNPAGLAFLMCSALAFQTTKILSEEPHATTVAAVMQADQMLRREDHQESVAVDDAGPVHTGPAGRLLATPVVPLAGGAGDVAARCLAVAAHLAVLAGLILVGRWHFSDTNLGLAMATLYLLLPCTAYDGGRVTHVLPAALILWAVVAHQRPVFSGVMLGLACGTMFFAVFLLPIWVAYYWGRGARRFTLAVASVTLLLIGSLALTSADTASFTRQIIGSIDWSALKFDAGTGVGFWSLYDTAYRIPVFTAFLVMLVSVTIWPLRKSLEDLLAATSATIVATQFWYPHEGGVYVLWYLPIVLLVVFRPRLSLLALHEQKDPTLAVYHPSGDWTGSPGTIPLGAGGAPPSNSGTIRLPRL